MAIRLRLLLALTALVSTPAIAQQTQMQWGYLSGSPSQIQFKIGSTWYPIGTFDGSVFSIDATSLPPVGSNTVVANVTASTSPPMGILMPSCDTATKALQWTTNTGFTCNSALQAARANTNSITNTMLAQMSTDGFKGNNTGGASNVLDLTPTQATALLDPFTGDSGSGGVKGLVPAPNAGDAAAGRFLGSGGTFALPPRPLNLMPNSQWEIFSLNRFITKMGVEGKGTQIPVSVTSYSTGINLTTFNTANTQQLKAGDVFYCTGGGTDPAVSAAPMRVQSLTVNTSFTAYLPLRGAAAASSATTCIPITAGDSTGSTIYTADYYTKPAATIAWRDDFSSNIQAGSPYSLGLRKGAASEEQIVYHVPENELPQFRGRTVVFGGWVYQKTQDGAANATWRLAIYDGKTATYSSYGTGASVGGFQWIEVSKTISSSATVVDVWLALDGVVGDVYYWSQPMLSFGTILGTGNYQPKFNEHIWFRNHINPALFTPFVGTFPSTTYYGGSTSWYGYELDMAALTHEQIARTVRTVTTKIETTSASVGITGANLFTQDNMGIHGHTIFGPQCVTQVASVMTACFGDVPLDHTSEYLANNPGWWAMSTGTSTGIVFDNITIDFVGAQLN